MTTTPKTMYQDLLDAQKEIEPVDKDGTNPHYKSDFASLNATIQACKDVLNKHNFIVLQPIMSDENGVYVCTTLFHTESGEKIESKMRVIPARDNDPQAQGSAITYARRYSLKSILCLSDADDDGERAMDRPVQKPQAVSGAANQALGACPKCGAALVEKTTKAGQKMTKCSTNKWSAATEQYEGCDYIMWGSAKPQVEEEDYPLSEPDF